MSCATVKEMLKREADHQLLKVVFMQLFIRLREGRKYMKKWPLNSTLAAGFPEGRIIKATQMAITWMPIVVMFGLTVQLTQGGEEMLPLALAQAALILSIPFQGLYWLGWRAKQPLPLPLIQWCMEVRERLVQAGCRVGPIAPYPQYQHMACLLKRAFEHLDSASGREN